nr:MAG TPA: Head Tail Connector Protein [Caudoviricetes sp.]
MNFKVIERPRAEPVNEKDMKTYLRLDSDDDIALVKDLITVARSYCENYQHRAYMTQTIELTANARVIELPRSEELQKVTAVEINGEVIPEAWYQIKPGLVATVELDVLTDSIVTVRYITGVELAEDVPEEVKQAIRLLVTHWYENRIAVSFANTIPREVPFAVKSLLDMGRVISL